VAAALLLVRPLVTLPLVIPLDYNEGWNAFHAARAMAGAPLYPPPTAVITHNYPPLSFYLVGTLGTWLGDHMASRRCWRSWRRRALPPPAPGRTLATTRRG
jgi:hypothetical protein